MHQTRDESRFEPVGPQKALFSCFRPTVFRLSARFVASRVSVTKAQIKPLASSHIRSLMQLGESEKASRPACPQKCHALSRSFFFLVFPSFLLYNSDYCYYSGAFQELLIAACRVVPFRWHFWSFFPLPLFLCGGDHDLTWRRRRRKKAWPCCHGFLFAPFSDENRKGEKVRKRKCLRYERRGGGRK